MHLTFPFQKGSLILIPYSKFGWRAVEMNRVVSVCPERIVARIVNGFALWPLLS
jgi:hypothetical protein